MEEKEHQVNRLVDSVNEPLLEYATAGKKHITFFKTFEEAAEADYEFYRNLTPVQRMEIHYELSLRVYGESPTNFSRRFSF